MSNDNMNNYTKFISRQVTSGQIPRLSEEETPKKDNTKDTKRK